MREQGPDRSSLSVASTPAQLPDSDTMTPSSPVSSDPGQDPSYINVDIGDNPGPVVVTLPPGPGYLNITQELPNTLGQHDLRHEYENIGPDTQVPAHSPSYIPPRNMFILPPKPPHLITQVATDSPPAISDAKDDVTSDENDNMERNDSVIESINYIVLDLDQGKASSPSPQSPSVPSVTGKMKILSLRTFCKSNHSLKLVQCLHEAMLQLTSIKLMLSSNQPINGRS